jgi:hypothetical protein
MPVGTELGGSERSTLGASEFVGSGADESSVTTGALVGIAVGWSIGVNIGRLNG